MPSRIRGPSVPTPPVSTPSLPNGPAVRDSVSSLTVRGTSTSDGFSNTPARSGPSVGDPDFASLVRSLQPRLHSPTSYEAHFGERGRTARAYVDGQGHIDLPTGTGRGPSFTAEAGKPLVVTMDPARVFESTEKVELVWRVVPHGTEQVIPLTDGTRDPDTGRLVVSPGRIELPEDADGLVRLSFRTHSNGRASNSWDPSYDAAIAPKHASTLIFSEDWKTQLDRPVRAGDTLKIAYDQDRIASLFGGRTPTGVTACISFNGERPLELPLTLTPGEGGRPGTMAMPALKVPVDATKMTVWFKGQSGGDTTWDSSFGRNFTFEVSPTRDDLEPGWKAELLRSTSFPNLKAENFAAIGPYSERYNCIAWTIGVRDEWVWPGTKVADFDALYERHGYRPLDTMDLSHDPTMEKIVIYGLPPRGGNREIEVTHGALQDARGRWTSKIGTQPLIRHDNLEDLAGPSYGEPVRVYVRPRAGVHS